MKKYVAIISVSLTLIVGCSPSLESQCTLIGAIVFTNPPPFTNKESAVNFYKDKANKFQQANITEPKLKAIQTRFIDSAKSAAEIVGNPPNKESAQKLQKSFTDDLSLTQEFVKLCPNGFKQK
ncbi:hypothetical protein TUMEXPCC7403_03850 [Tumidithrix helvetica PCC 7403]|uniref:hypothetical protein n=1 Tax=Tumidithrix helvetica TaxID=3457545 RepID=UPI003C8E1E72